MQVFADVANQLGIDSSFWYLLGLFAGFHFLFSVVFSRPFQAVLENRKRRTDGARAEAEELTKKAQEAIDAYRTRLRAAHSQAREVSSKIENDARREEATILDAATAKAKAMLSHHQAELEAQRRELLKALESDAALLAREIAERLLGKKTARS